MLVLWCWYALLLQMLMLFLHSWCVGAVWLFPVSAVALVVVMGSAVQCCVAVLVVLG